MNQRPANRLERGEYLSKAKEFAKRGQDLPQTKLLSLDIISIRSAARQRSNLLKHIKENLSNASLAKQYGVHIKTIEKVIQCKTHNQIP